MINLNQKAEITITGYLSQVEDYVSMWCYTDFIVETIPLKKVYINKYAKKDYFCTLHAFEVVTC